MARDTTERHVCPGQWELRLRMVEFCSRPTRGRVANRTVGRETCRCMSRIRGLVPVIDVARITIGRRAGKFVIHVARRAGQADMHAGQREFGCRIVVPGRTQPRRRGVAVLARVWKSRRRMRRRGRLVVLVRVARITIGRSTGEFAIHVTRRASHGYVRPSQRKPGLAVIKTRG